MHSGRKHSTKSVPELNALGERVSGFKGGHPWLLNWMTDTWKKRSVSHCVVDEEGGQKDGKYVNKYKQLGHLVGHAEVREVGHHRTYSILIGLSL